MASTTKPCTFLLVPGSFVTPEEYDKVDTLLQKQGHSTKLVPLQTANDGSRIPPATMDDDAALIRSTIVDILDTQHHNVVLALHSYAGIPGNSAVAGLTTSARHSAGKDTSVIGILIIASFLPQVGESLRDVFANKNGELVDGDFLQEPFKSGIKGEYLPPVPQEMAPYIFNDLADQPDEIDKYFGLMVRHASDSYSAGATYAAWGDGTKTTVLIPENDVILPVVIQEAMVERATKAGGKIKRVFVPGAGHCVNISKPDLVVRELEELAGLKL